MDDMRRLTDLVMCSLSRCKEGGMRLMCTGAAALSMPILVGCEYDSWMDPSVVGRWENTAASAPILDRLDVIETNADEFAVKTSTVKPDDLIPEVAPYVVGAGDALQIEIFELLGRDTTFQTDRVVSPTGEISLPTVGIVACSGLTVEEIKARIGDALIQKGVLLKPEVSVIATTQEHATYGVMGQVQNVARFPIPQPRFLLLDALAVAGGIPDSAEKVYVIRQVPLADEVIRGWGANQAPGTAEGSQAPAGDGSAEQIEKMIRDLQNAQPAEQPTDEPPATEPGAKPAGGHEELLDIPEPTDLGNSGKNRPMSSQSESVRAESPSIRAAPQAPGERPTFEQDLSDIDDRSGRWVYLNDQWVRLAVEPGKAPNAGTNEESGWLDEASRFVTQRVIEIPVKALIAGDARYNIVIRPNDIIRVPFPQTGTIFLDGQVARPGPIRFPDEGRITLVRAIAAAGGLGPLAIPERVEIMRLVGQNRQATVTVNYRAIKEMTEPDVWLKSGDVINVGTTWYAAPLAVIRNGFRTTYGFGFLLDRNFGNDVFGAPPTNRFGE